MGSRIVVVDTYPVIRWGMCRLLGEQSDLEVVADTGSAAEAVKLTAGLHPDVVTVGLTAAEGYGLGLARELHDRSDDLGVVVLGADDGDDVLLQAFESGLSAYVPKSAPVQEVVAAVRHASAAATSFTSSGLAAALRRRAEAESSCDLSTRERQVLTLLVSGSSVPTIAVMLHISPSTAKTYVSRVYEKLGARNRAEAVMAAVRLGLADRPPVPAPRAPLASVAF